MLTRLFWRDTYLGDDAGFPIYALDEAMGTSAVVQVSTSNTDAFEDLGAWRASVGEGIDSDQFPTSFVITARGNGTVRIRIERRNSAGDVLAFSDWGVERDTVGTHTETFTMATTWAAGDLLTIRVQGRRAAGTHGGSTVDIGVNREGSFVDASFAEPAGETYDATGSDASTSTQEGVGQVVASSTGSDASTSTQEGTAEVPGAGLHILWVQSETWGHLDPPLVAIAESAGHTVTLILDTAAEPTDMTPYDVVFISESASGTSVGTKYSNGVTPVLNGKAGTFANFNYATSFVNYNGTGGDIVEPTHPIMVNAGNLSGTVTLYPSTTERTATGLVASAVVLMTRIGEPTHPSIFVMEKGVSLLNGQTAQSRHVAWALHDTQYGSLTADGEALWLSALEYTAGVFSPANTPDLAFWLKGNDPATITESGGVVSAWNDKSGNAYHVSQGTEADRPTLTTLNGKTALAFDGSVGQVLTGGASGLGRNLAGATVFAVVRWDVAPTQYQTPFYVRAATNARWVLGTHSNGNANLGGRTLDSDPWQSIVSDEATAPATYVLTGAFDYANTRAILRANGKQVAVTEAFQTATTTSDTDSTARTIGGVNVNSERMNGVIAEIIVYHRVLSDAERDEVEAYLAEEWGAPTDYLSTALADAPLALWPLDVDGRDESGNARHLSTVQATFQTGTGLWERWLEFGGTSTSDYAELASPAALNLPGPLTYEAWVWVPDLWAGSDDTAFLMGLDDRAGIRRRGAGSPTSWYVRDDGGTNIGADSFGQDITTLHDQWVHLVGVYDRPAQKQRFYVNGVLEVETDTADTAAATNVTAPFALGAHYNQPDAVGATLQRFFAGRLAWVAVYDSALSTERVSAHYAAGGDLVVEDEAVDATGEDASTSTQEGSAQAVQGATGDDASTSTQVGSAQVVYDATGSDASASTQEGSAQAIAGAIGSDASTSTQAGQAEIVDGSTTYDATGSDASASTQEGQAQVILDAAGADASASTEAGTGQVVAESTGSDASASTETGEAQAILDSSGFDASTSTQEGAAQTIAVSTGEDASTSEQDGTVQARIGAIGADASTSTQDGVGEIVGGATGEDASTSTQDGFAQIVDAPPETYDATGHDASTSVQAGVAHLIAPVVGVDESTSEQDGAAHLIASVVGTDESTSTESGSGEIVAGSTGSDASTSTQQGQAEVVGGVTTYDATGSDASTSTQQGEARSILTATGEDASISEQQGGTQTVIAGSTGEDASTSDESGVISAILGSTGEDISTSTESGVASATLGATGEDISTSTSFGLAGLIAHATGEDISTSTQSGISLSGDRPVPPSSRIVYVVADVPRIVKARDSPRIVVVPEDPS